MGLSIDLPKDFVESTRALLGSESPDFFDALNEMPPTSIRKNPFKGETSHLNITDPVPWNRFGNYLESRPSFVDDPAFFQGSYYVQEASSMITGSIALWLSNQSKIHSALDLCSAPGGKSTDILSQLPDLELLVSNELVGKRVRALEENIIKWGLTNSIITHTSPESFQGIGEQFDLVVVDAPCSGEGMFRKDSFALQQWSPGSREKCSEIQGEILKQVWPSLRQGGFLIYSTCTLNQEENEKVMEKHQVKFDIIPHQVPELETPDFFKTEWGNATPVGRTYRFLPQRISGEGFTVTLIQKGSSEGQNKAITTKRSPQKHWKPTPYKNGFPFALIDQPLLQNGEDLLLIDDSGRRFLDRFSATLNFQYAGRKVGRISRKDSFPTHDLTMMHGFQYDSKVELTKEQALHYLRRESLTIPGIPKGWVLCTYNGSPLGWGKSQNDLLKNHYPKEFKIRKQLPHF